MVAVESVAAPAEIIIKPFRCKHIINVIVKPLKWKIRSVLISLRSMVKHHVQIHLDSMGIKQVDQTLQFISLPVILLAGSIAGIGWKEADRIVSPVIVQLFPINLPVIQHFIKLKYGHQLHCIDPQFHQIGDFLLKPLKCARKPYAWWPMLCIPPHMKLVYDQVLHGDQRLGVITPVKVILYHPGLVTLAQSWRLTPKALSGYCFCIWVQQVFGWVKDQPLFRLPRSSHPISVLKLPNVQLEYDHGVDIADSVMLRKWQHGIRLILGPPE